MTVFFRIAFYKTKTCPKLVLLKYSPLITLFLFYFCSLVFGNLESSLRSLYLIHLKKGTHYIVGMRRTTASTQLTWTVVWRYMKLCQEGSTVLEKVYEEDPDRE